MGFFRASVDIGELKRQGDVAALVAVVGRNIKKSKSEPRSQALSAIGELGQRALPEVMKEMTHEAQYGPETATLCLAHIGAPAVPSLVEMLTDGMPWREQVGLMTCLVIHQFAHAPLLETQEDQLVRALGRCVDECRSPEKWRELQEAGVPPLDPDFVEAAARVALEKFERHEPYLML